MKITETLSGAMRRIAGVSAASSATAEKKRRTMPLPSIFNSYGPPGDIMPKPTAYNLRRFSEIPVARRAINPDEIGVRPEWITVEGDLRTLPCHFDEYDGIDGFFCARLVKDRSPASNR